MLYTITVAYDIPPGSSAREYVMTDSSNRKGCQNNCDVKADCNPGWDTDEFSKKDKCPLNVCCSDHGFCGYTEEFCGDNDQVERPSCSASDKPVDRLIGYYEAWSTKERSCFGMTPEQIPFGQYSHIIFSFATINADTFRVSAGDVHTEVLMSRIGSIKLVQPDIKIWLAIGGWAFNDPGPTQTTFSDIAKSSENINTFLDSLVSMMSKYGFDGIDIDWEYPVAEDRNGRPEDYKNIVTFMKSLRERMDTLNKGVSMAIPASYWYLQDFDIVKLEATVDWFNLMSYDMHGSWDIDNEHTGPWVNSHSNMTEIQLALDLLWRNDISPSKVTMGMSYYSRSFTLTDPDCSDLGCEVSSAGNPGRCSDTAGVLLHPEIKEIVEEEGLSATLHREAAVKTISWGNQWVSFDDLATWRLKANVARSQCITGFMVWAMSQDDRQGTNVKALNQALGRKTVAFPDFDQPEDTPAPALPPKLCRWTSCFEGCPSGFKEVQRDGHKEIMMDDSYCGSYYGHGYSRLCCPSSHSPPTCSWRGHRNSGNCKPGCNPGEVEIGTLRKGCSKKHQSACCEDTEVTSAYGECIWTDCTKTPEDACIGSYTHFVASSSIGSGGAGRCRASDETKAMCCTQPPPAEFDNNCKWYNKVGFLDDDKLCEGACPKGHIRLALDRKNDDTCWGDTAFCCEDLKPLDPRDDEDDEDDEDNFGSSQTKEFKLLLEKYLDNPTCPATNLEVPLHDLVGKRSIVAESRQYEVLQGRAEDCTIDNWTRLLAFATLMFSMLEPEFDPIRKVWDDNFAQIYGEMMQFEELEDFLYDYPQYETRALLEWILYSPQEADTSIRQIRRSGEIFCSCPEDDLRRSDEGKRAIHVPGDGRVSSRPDIPTIDTILRGILEGDLTLHYARWQWQSGQGSNSAEGPFLELAYWIGPEPGESTTGDPHYDQYRDSSNRSGRGNTGRWVGKYISSLSVTVLT